MKKILAIVGTRPEAIKMTPIIQALKNEPWVDLRVLATAQHRHLLDQVLNVFGIEPDIDLDIMRPNQALTTLTARLLLDLDDVLLAEKPDAVLVQGDTTTVLAVALACFYQGIPVGHVEAGLRTWNISNPFPEEANFAAALKRSYLILTDSGGIQEEAPALGKPVLVLRNETERPEAIEQGVAKLVGTHVDHIMQATQHLLDDTAIYQAMAKGISPYGDGHAAERIVNVLKEHFS